jgi:hypothetical protein
MVNAVFEGSRLLTKREIELSHDTAQPNLNTKGDKNMPDYDVSELRTDGFVRKEDIPEPRVFQISDVTIDEVKDDRGGMKEKPILHFEGDPVRPMVLNTINIKRLEEAFGRRTGQWVGQEVELYVDGEVMFGGKKIGGLRVRPLNPSQCEMELNR